MKKILLIGTGGTIASKEMGDGLTPELAAKEIVSYVPEVQNLCEIEVLQLCNIDSTNMHPKIWTELAKAVQKNFDRYDGFVVLHGTDTMAYTASALSFVFEGLAKPIVFTGSQLPVGKLRTDGKENLITAAMSPPTKPSQLFLGDTEGKSRSLLSPRHP